MAVGLSLAASVTAQQYAVGTALLNIGGTNATSTATNVSAVASNGVTLTKWSDFELEVKLGLTNPATGTYDIAWTTSDDATSWASAPAMPGASGWFSVPLTNGGAPVTWRTNITVGTAGYWRVTWATNASGQSMTQQIIRPYTKPRRYGS